MNLKLSRDVIGLLLLALMVERPSYAAAPMTDRLIVRFSDLATTWQAPNTTLASTLARRLGGSMLALRQTAEGSHVVALPYPMGLDEAQAFAAQIKRNDPRVAFAEPDILLRPLGAPISVKPLAATATVLSWDAIVGLTKAWAITPGSPDIRVGMVDSGITGHHLLTRVTPGYDFVAQVGDSGIGDSGRDADASDPGDFVTTADVSAGGMLAGMPGCEVADSSWHGTAIAGLMVADRDDALGVAGVMQQGKVVPLRASWKCGGYLSDMVDAVLWGAGIALPGAPVNAHPARIINISLGYTGACSQFEASAYQRVYEAGVAVVAAAGNDGGNSTQVSPGNCPHVIAVAASDGDGNLADYSSRGANVTLMAPGGAQTKRLPVLSDRGTTSPAGDTVTSGEGTSFAAPWVSGTVGLMLSVNPDLGPDGIWQTLLYSATPNLACSGTCGGGMLNIGKAVKLARDGLYYAESVFDFGATVAVSDRPLQVSPFTNLSGKPIRVSSVSLSGLSSTHFQIAHDTCSGTLLADRAACEVGIRLFTTVAGEKEATLLLSTDTPAGEVRVAVQARVQPTSAPAVDQPTGVDSGGGGGGGGCALYSNHSAVVGIDPTIILLFTLALWQLRRRSILRKNSWRDGLQYID
jgi:serine protease